MFSATGLPPRLGGDPVPTHRPGHRLDAAGLAPGDRFRVHARATVAGPPPAADRPPGDPRGLATPGPGPPRPPPPVVIARGGDVQDPAHRPDRPSPAVGLDEVGSHDDPPAKEAVAPFGVSRPIVG